MDLLVARNFAIALFIGALVGIDREKRKATDDHVAIGGIRTFILFAEAGAVSAWLAVQTGSLWIFAVGVLAITAVVIAGYLAHARVHPDSLGLTTEAAAIAVCLLGGAVMFGYPEVAVALAIATSSVLAFKQPIHGLVEKIGTDDLYAGLKLLLATFIALPLLPNRTIDPWDALNPYTLWLLVILISGLSLAGYIAVRWLGPGRGTAVTAVAGGLVSSTAVTLSFARRSREHPGGRGNALLAGGIVLAWMVMFGRVAVEVAVVNRALLRELLVPVASMGAAAGIVALVLLRGSVGSARPAGGEVPLQNPFSLTAAIRFALVFASVMLLVVLVQTYLPGRGLYAVAALAGLSDVDAITLSMASCVGKGECAAQTGVASIIIAALSNTLLKAGMVVALAAPALRRPILGATGAIFAAALLALALAPV
ncbi:MAG TPA: MgtC/SapB family protein, partial [Myxococcota bacterium]